MFSLPEGEVSFALFSFTTSESSKPTESCTIPGWLLVVLLPVWRTLGTVLPPSCVYFGFYLKYCSCKSICCTTSNSVSCFQSCAWADLLLVGLWLLACQINHSALSWFRLEWLNHSTSLSQSRSCETPQRRAGVRFCSDAAALSHIKLT